MKHRAVGVAFLEALGLVVYVSIAALCIRYLNVVLQPHLINPVVQGIILLLLFVISALVSASLILGYPILLFFRGDRSLALRIVGLSALWLVFFFLAFVLVASLLG